MSDSRSTLDVLHSFLNAGVERYEHRNKGFDLFDTTMPGIAGAVSEYPEYLVKKEIIALLEKYAGLGYSSEEKLSELSIYILKMVENWNIPASSDPVHNALTMLYHSAYTKMIPLIRH